MSKNRGLTQVIQARMAEKKPNSNCARALSGRQNYRFTFEQDLVNIDIKVG